MSRCRFQASTLPLALALGLSAGASAVVAGDVADTVPAVHGAPTDLASAAKALGDLGQDLVFTPVTPCRIVDTRVVGGPIAAGQVRSFDAAGRTSFAGQGGASEECGLQAEAPSVVVLSVAAVAPTADGMATVNTFGTPLPPVAHLDYSAGDTLSQTIIVRVPNPSPNQDFSIYTSASSDFVVDIAGYFAAPRPTALQCIDTAQATTSISPGATGQVTAPSCPAGYTAVNLDCESGSWSMPIVFSSLRGGGNCGARNEGTGAAVLIAVRRCCRVPGR